MFVVGTKFSKVLIIPDIQPSNRFPEIWDMLVQLNPGMYRRWGPIMPHRLNVLAVKKRVLEAVQRINREGFPLVPLRYVIRCLIQLLDRPRYPHLQEYLQLRRATLRR